MTPEQVANYVGRPWVRGEYDCWSLVRDVYADCYGIDIPNAPIDAGDLRQVIKTLESSAIRSQFHRVKNPVDGCLAEMGERHPVHIGIYIETPDGPFIMHNHAASGVVCEKEPQTPVLNYWCHGARCTTA